MRNILLRNDHMLIENEFYKVKINIDPVYMVDSADNRHYDIVLNPDNMKQNDFYKVLNIHVENRNKEYDIALVGGYFSYDSDCAVLEENRLTVLQDDKLTQINLNDGNIIFCKRFDSFTTNFAIYEAPCGYVVYGEMQITGLDKNFEKLWHFMGKDIFVTCSGKNPFELCENSIRLYDFEDNFYEINYDGTLLTHKIQ